MGKGILSAVLPGINRGRYANDAAKHPGEIIAVGEAAGIGYEGYTMIALLQKQLGLLHPDLY